MRLAIEGSHIMAEVICKSALIAKMTENLKVLRNKLNLTQDELASKIGISRQTLVGIENRRRDMSWNTFVALIAVFRAECSTSDLLDHFGIYTAELNSYLTSPENAHSG
jgi:DNA-binding XRE family transcriptional regulator